MSESACVDPSASKTTAYADSASSTGLAITTAKTTVSADGIPNVEQAGTLHLEAEDFADNQQPQLLPNGQDPDAVPGEVVSGPDSIGEGDGNDKIEDSDDDGDLSDGSLAPDAEMDYHTNGTQYVRDRNKLSLEERLKQAPRRLRQYRDYVKLVEDRLLFLESRLAVIEAAEKVEPTVEPPPPVLVEPPVEPPTFGRAIPRLNRVRWERFKAPPVPGEECTLDVLVGEPMIQFQKPNRRGTTGTNPKVSANAWKEDAIPSLESLQEPKDTVNASAGGHGQLAERIRINSLPLIRILEMIHGEAITVDDSPVIMFRPYRALIYYEEEIREWLKKLENMFADNKDGGKLSNDDAATPANENKHNTTPTSQNERFKIPETSRENGEEEFPSNTDKKHLLDDLRCLVSFIDNDVKQRAEKVQGGSISKIFFSDIWHLFKPGDEVLAADRRQAYRVVQITGVNHRSTYANLKGAGHPAWEATPVFLHCVYLDFNGKLLGPVSKVIELPTFEGEREIRSLPVYPLRFANDYEDLRARLIKRGALFMQLVEVKHVQFTGVTLDTQEEVDSQAVVDFEQTLQHEVRWAPVIQSFPTGDGNGPEPVSDHQRPCYIRGCCSDECSHRDAYVDQNRMREFTREQPALAIYTRTLQAIKEGSGLREHELVLLTHRLFAFILRSRKWACIDIDDVKEIHRVKDSDGFDLLVLPDGHKEMVQSLVRQHFREKDSKFKDEEQVDLVRGKGKGLIILLHGAPGVGKTSTAECVAESFNKPLFPITCGDLGVTAWDVENRLQTNFTLAHRWGCVLLLDEADIFLAERTKDDFLRNSLVSVFLRVLEYYSGILFLTTNRVGAIDEAFKSRIHISLYYPTLDESSTIEIWKMNLDRTKKRKAKFKFEIKEKEILKFARKHYLENEEGRWNGRQIRNAFQTAIALAEFEADQNDSDEDAEATRITRRTTLRKAHFETVAQASLHFDKYMTEVFAGKSASDRAYDLNNRYDQYGIPEAPAFDPRYGGQHGYYAPHPAFDRHGPSPAVSRDLDPRRTIYNDKPAPSSPKPSKSTRESGKSKKKQEEEEATSESAEATSPNDSEDTEERTSSESESESVDSADSAAETQKKKKAPKEKDTSKGKEKRKGKEKNKEKEEKKKTDKEIKKSKEKRRK